jgi:polysaccharide export outer membrane protein
VSVAGKTCKQVAAEAKQVLDKDYYYNATVVIGLDQMSQKLGTVYVFGPVLKPGPVPIPANETFTVRKAILLAGGFGDFASKTDVKVIRKTPAGNTTLTVNMKNVMEKGKIEEDIALEPEDFIIVRQKSFNL